jgi:hypothetical protein
MTLCRVLCQSSFQFDFVCRVALGEFKRETVPEMFRDFAGERHAASSLRLLPISFPVAIFWEAMATPFPFNYLI